MSYDKYVKYKNKYLQLKAIYTQIGGVRMWIIDESQEKPKTTAIYREESEALNVAINLGNFKWYSYINRKKAETDLAINIKNKFGKDVILIQGDWSDKLKTTPSRIKYISTPNLGLKRKLDEYLTIYNIDEFRASCLNYKTEERCENMYLPDKKGVIVVI